MSTPTDREAHEEEEHGDAQHEEEQREEEQREEEQHGPSKLRKAAKFGRGLYQQVASTFSAIGMLALIAGLWHLGLRGVIAWLVGIWDATVRPAVAFVLHGLVTVPLGWIHVHFEVPVVVRDYLSVGLVLALSARRERKVPPTPAKFYPAVIIPGTENYPNLHHSSWYLFLLYWVNWPPAILAIWPLMLFENVFRFFIYPLITWPGRTDAYYAFLVSGDREYLRQDRLFRKYLRRKTWAGEQNFAASVLRVQAPLIYLGILLALNFWVLR